MFWSQGNTCLIKQDTHVLHFCYLIFWRYLFEIGVERMNEWKLLSCVQLCATSWTVAHQAPLSMDFSGKNTGVGSHYFSRGSSQPRDWIQVSCIADAFFTIWATREAPQIGVVSSLNIWKKIPVRSIVPRDFLVWMLVIMV